MPRKISLKQFLMKTGKFNKVFDCVSAVRKGKITIENMAITNPNYFFDAKKFVAFDGEKLKLAKKLYYALNKPAGYLCQKSPNEKNIYDLIEKLPISNEQKSSLFSVGRLDKDTEGLMILTNDGKISTLLMNPENKSIKRYLAILEKPISYENIRLLEKGVIIEIDENKYKTTKCEIKKTGENEVYISITEGKKRQIRKMFKSVGNEIVYLKRVSIGGLQLGKLNLGEIKQITREEIMEKLEF